jgi:pilus assembly protein FimV
MRSAPTCKTFDTQARQLRDLTKGLGEDWLRAQELGRQIDPTNPLYRQGGDYPAEDTTPTPLEPLADDADATLIRPPVAAMADAAAQGIREHRPAAADRLRPRADPARRAVPGA